jgi:hypothetical protein
MQNCEQASGSRGLFVVPQQVLEKGKRRIYITAMQKETRATRSNKRQGLEVEFASVFVTLLLHQEN